MDNDSGSSESSVKIDDPKTLRAQVREYEKLREKERAVFESAMKSWHDHSKRVRTIDLFCGGAVGLISGVFVVGFIFTHILPTVPEVIERPTGVTLAEYKHIVNSLDRCNENFQWCSGEVNDLQIDNDYLYNLKLWAAYDDAGNARCAHKGMLKADEICQRCQDEIVAKLWHCWDEREEECWCPFETNAYGLEDPCNEPTNLDLERMLDEMCTELEGGAGQTSSPLGLAWMRGCVGVKGRQTSDFIAFFPDYEWREGQ